MLQGVEGEVHQNSLDDSWVNGDVRAILLTRTNLHLSHVSREGEVCCRSLQQIKAKSNSEIAGRATVN